MSDSVIVVENPAKTVVVSAPGPQGPQGPPGAPGPAGGEHYIYDRNGVPAATWTIVHNLGRLGHVTVLGDDGVEVLTDVETSLNTTVVTFASPFSGKAIIG